MKKLVLILFLLIALVSCAEATTVEQNDPVLISATTGKTMMDDNPEIILVDVRTQSEFDEGHIEGAILLPLDTLSSNAQKVLKDKSAIIIVYCRSGNRSATAVDLLYDLGYANLYDMGGIIYWPYGIVN
jgi:rhodanese-related sulfurtransferase